MKSSLTILGSGGSMGVPVIGCKCDVCHSTSVRNKRFRSSALLRVGDKKFLIDVGPDFRQQALLYEIDHLDGVIVTHMHQDHFGGADELRVFRFQSDEQIPILLSQEAWSELLHRFHYLEKLFAPQILEENEGSTSFLGLPLSFISYYQGKMKVTGFRFGDLAYVTDIKDYNETIIETLKGVNTLVVSALREAPESAVHFSIQDAIEFSEIVGAKTSWFTHIAHEVEHERASRNLPTGMGLAYDGLELSLEINHV